MGMEQVNGLPRLTTLEAMKPRTSEAVGGQTPAEPELPTLGRVVHFVLPDGKHKGSHRLAFITNEPMSLVVNLLVVADTDDDFPDYPPTNTCRCRCVSYDGPGRRSGSWHWPERI
jgi:hypothetical protein